MTSQECVRSHKQGGVKEVVWSPGQGAGLGKLVGPAWLFISFRFKVPAPQRPQVGHEAGCQISLKSLLPAVSLGLGVSGSDLAPLLAAPLLPCPHSAGPEKGFVRCICSPDAVLWVLNTVNVTAEAFPGQPAHGWFPHEPILQHQYLGHLGQQQHWGGGRDGDCE
jgi:hypothetical protein